MPIDPFVQVHQQAVVAVLIIDDEDHAVPVARALLKGGVLAMELTLRTDAAMGALRRIRAEVPEMIVGVGTVLNVGQVSAIVEADASFGVSPGVNPRVIQAAIDLGLPFAPGIVTPSDIERALEFGCHVLKFFPAEPSGGVSYLKAIAAPYAHFGLTYMPLGGVNETNMVDYLKEPSVAAIGGSWLANKQLMAAGNWEQITENARSAVSIARRIRPLA